MRTLALLLLTLPTLAIHAKAQEIPARPRVQSQIRNPAFFEIQLKERPYYVQELIEVTLIFGFEQQFLKRNMLQMLTRRMDIPAQIQATWTETLPGAILLPEELTQSLSSGERRLRFVLNERVTRAERITDRKLDGKIYTVLKIHRTFLAKQSGTLEIPAAHLSFSHATQFEEDFDGRLIPQSPTHSQISTKAQHLQILDLPSKGQPLDFHDAVGSFRIKTSATPLALKAGATVKVRIQIEGRGNLHQLTPPDLSKLSKLHLLGFSEADAEQPDLRSLAYDLVPIDGGVFEIPAIAFSYFDPRPPAQYRRASSKPIPLKVSDLAPNRASTRVPPEKTPGFDDIFGLKDTAQGDGKLTPSSRGLRTIVVLGPWLAALLFLAFRRSLAKHRTPAAKRERSAQNQFHLALERGETTTALVDYLAARMDCKVAAVVTPDLSERLEAQGITAKLAMQTAQVLESLVAADYGGAQADCDQSALARLVSALESAFRGG